MDPLLLLALLLACIAALYLLEQIVAGSLSLIACRQVIYTRLMRLIPVERRQVATNPYLLLPKQSGEED